MSQILITSMESNLCLFASREDSLLLAPQPIPSEAHRGAPLRRAGKHSSKRPNQPAGAGSKFSTFIFPTEYNVCHTSHLHHCSQMATLLASKMGPSFMVPNTTEEPDCPWHLVQRSKMPRRTGEVSPFLPTGLCNLWIPRIFWNRQQIQMPLGKGQVCVAS